MGDSWSLLGSVMTPPLMIAVLYAVLRIPWDRLRTAQIRNMRFVFEPRVAEIKEPVALSTPTAQLPPKAKPTAKQAKSATTKRAAKAKKPTVKKPRH